VTFIINFLPKNLDVTQINWGSETNIIKMIKNVIFYMYENIINLTNVNTNNLFLYFINLIGSIFGIFLPFFLGLYYSLLITIKIIYSSLKLPMKNIDQFKGLVYVLILFLLGIMLKDVHIVLGNYFFIITIFIIFVTAIIMLK